MIPSIGQAYAYFTEPQQGGFCQELDFLMYMLGAIATILAYMCALPEPAIVIICPAAGIIGIIFGLVALIEGVFCLN
jgi:hypothetical protein